MKSKTSDASANLIQTIEMIPQLVNKDHVLQMIDFQITAIDRLEGINNSLDNCNKLAQSRLVSTSKLFKKTAKQMNESKKDLQVIHKKITELKLKIKADRPDLFVNEVSGDAAD